MQPRTLIDIELAKVYFEILAAKAKYESGATIEYGQLVKMAKEKYPDNQAVKSAIAMNIGRRLDTLREFTSKNNLPDLSALVVNKATGDNGDGFTRTFNGDVVRKQISDFDWSSVEINFENFISEQRQAYEQKQVKKNRLRKVPEDDARRLYWEHYKAHPEEFINMTNKDKESVIKLMMQGIAVSAALSEIRSVK